MAFVATANTAEVEVRQMLFGQLIENTLYFHNPDGWDADSLLTLATAIGAWWAADIMPHLTSQLTMREIVARDLTTATGSQAVDPSWAGIAGGVEGTSVPSNVALAISFRTALSGRSFRGRNYISGFDVDHVPNNTINTGVADALVAAYNDLQTAVTEVLAGVTWVVVSKFSEGVPRLAGEVTTVLVASLTDYFVDSMRRRLTGRGM